MKPNNNINNTSLENYNLPSYSCCKNYHLSTQLKNISKGGLPNYFDKPSVGGTKHKFSCTLSRNRSC